MLALLNAMIIAATYMFGARKLVKMLKGLGGGSKSSKTSSGGNAEKQVRLCNLKLLSSVQVRF